jgi:hydrogenase maturation protease
VLVLGYGNPLRGDDGVGRVVAQRLEQILSPAVAEIREAHQLTPELAEVIGRVQLVVFIDAACGGDPGAITSKNVQPGRGARAMEHRLGPEELLAVTRDVYGRCPEAHVLTIAGQNWACSESLSPEVDEVVPDVLDRIVSLIAARMPGATGTRCMS